MISIDSIDYLVTACSNQAAGVKDLFSGEWVKYQIIDSTFNSPYVLDFMSGTFFYGGKSYKDILNHTFSNPEKISGTFTFNYRGYVDIGNSEPVVNSTCRFYRFEWGDIAGGPWSRFVIPNDGENHDLEVKDLVISSISLRASWRDDGDLPINHTYIKVSQDFHLMWIFTPTSSTSL